MCTSVLVQYTTLRNGNGQPTNINIVLLQHCLYLPKGKPQQTQNEKATFHLSTMEVCIYLLYPSSLMFISQICDFSLVCDSYLLGLC